MKDREQTETGSASPVLFDNVKFMYPEGNKVIFSDLSLELPRGVMSLVGQNGAGKSTLLLLAGGRLLPTAGTVRLLGRPTTEFPDETVRNTLASFIYQNMEFESEAPIGELLEFVHDGGLHPKKDSSLVATLVKTFELEHVLGKHMQAVSKGELQRTIIAFSLLYGSPVILMDEPVFALEDHQKEYTFGFLMEYAAIYRVSIYYSVHELELSRRYSQSVLLFGKNGSLTLGPVSEVLTRENLEAAYQIPWSMLHKKENLYREMLRKT